MSDGLVGLDLGFFPDVEQELSHGLELRDPDVPRIALLGGVSLEHVLLSLLGHVLGPQAARGDAELRCANDRRVVEVLAARGIVSPALGQGDAGAVGVLDADVSTAVLSSWVAA